MADTQAIPATLDDLLAVLNRIAQAVESAGEAAELLAGPAAAGLCSLSLSKWHELNATGWAPSPVELGGEGCRCPRWSRRELLAWIRAGCLSRARWTIIREIELRNAG